MFSAILKSSLLFVLCLLTTACFGRTSIKEAYLNTSHDITVIPYKSPPIRVHFPTGYYPGGVVGQAIGSSIESSLKEDWRKSTIADLNKTAGSWNPYPIFTEECLKVLTSSSKVKIKKITIGEASEILGMESLRKEDSEPFKEYEHFINRDYFRAWEKYNDTDLSLQKYLKDYPQIHSDWYLEIYFFPYQHSSSRVSYSLTLKLSDSTNNKIASGFEGVEGYKFSEALNGYNFNDIQEIIRESVNQTCTKTLSAMGLI